MIEKASVIFSGQDLKQNYNFLWKTTVPQQYNDPSTTISRTVREIKENII